jgi:hypothetical protein
MLKRILVLVLGLAGCLESRADTVAIGTITAVATGINVIGIQVSATSTSPCGTGWFYSLTSDSNDASMSRLLASIMISWQTGATVYLYGVPTTCNQGTNTRFTSMTVVQ